MKFVNHRKRLAGPVIVDIFTVTVFFWDLWLPPGIYPLVNVRITMENHLFEWENTICGWWFGTLLLFSTYWEQSFFRGVETTGQIYSKWSFSIAMLNSQRGSHTGFLLCDEDPLRCQVQPSDMVSILHFMENSYSHAFATAPWCSRLSKKRQSPCKKIHRYDHGY